MRAVILALILSCSVINLSYGMDTGTLQKGHSPLIFDISIDTYTSHEYTGLHLRDIFRVKDGISDTFKIGAAFLANLFIHEMGHAVVADYVGASSNRINFFRRENGKFFLGMSYAGDVDDESVLPYTMGGEFATDLTFEHALKKMRRDRDMFYRALVFFSGVDFLWYCLYSYYLTPGDPGFDPKTLKEETGLSGDVIFGIALAKTAINSYRVLSGRDPVIPYFTVDRRGVMLNLSIPF